LAGSRTSLPAASSAIALPCRITERRVQRRRYRYRGLEQIAVSDRRTLRGLTQLAARARWNFSSSSLARTITASFSSTACKCAPGIAKYASSSAARVWTRLPTHPKLPAVRAELIASGSETMFAAGTLGRAPGALSVGSLLVSHALSARQNRPDTARSFRPCLTRMPSCAEIVRSTCA
jgi:hypothetical protein